MKKSETTTRSSAKIKSKRKKSEKPLFLPYTPQKPVSCYSREDIESILTNVLLVSVSLAAVLLTLSLLISVVKH